MPPPQTNGMEFVRSRFALICSAVGLLLSAMPALAGYDLSEWGMTLEQVQKLYPGGKVREGDSELGYSRLLEVGEQDLAEVWFTFSKYDNLKEVTLNFVSIADSRSYNPGKVSILAPRDAEAVWNRIESALRAKYGKPARVFAANPRSRQVTWVNQGRDEIVFHWEYNAETPEVNVVLLTYKPLKKKRHVTDRL